jgi:Zn-dependent protease
LGTIVLPAITLALSPFMFGWAKPVPVNFNNLRNPKRDMLWVAAAGPLSNLAMALIWAVALKAGVAAQDAYLGLPLALMGAAGVFINVIVMVLNLLPLPPLDGGRILVSLLPTRFAHGVSRIEPYGFVVLIVLLFTGVLGYVLWPPVILTMSLIAGGLGMPVADLFRLAQLH